MKLETAFPNYWKETNSEERINKMDFMYSFLKDIEPEKLNKAIHTFCLNTDNLFPSVNIMRELRKLALTEFEPLNATEALARVKRHRSEMMDSYRKNTINEQDRIILEAYDMIGYWEFKHTTRPEFTNNLFMKHYDQILKKYIQDKINL